MAKQNKNAGFQQAAGLIRYFDAEEETAMHIDPRMVLVAAGVVSLAVLALNIFIPLR
ncbi:MAG: preprotein translocase subunit Sec61beta [Thermoplasmatota archaeon]